MNRRLLPLLAVLASCLCHGQGSTLLEWRFDKDAEGWRAARHLADLAVADGVLRGKATGHDPQLISPLFEIKANPYQEFVARVRFSKAGKAALFYSNTTEGQYDGFTGKKVIETSVQADVWQTVRIRPFWQGEGKIVHVRFDPPPNADVEVDWIRIEDGTAQVAALAGPRIAVDPAQGWKEDDSRRWLAPPVGISVKGRDWLRVAMPPCAAGHLQVRWTTDQSSGLQTADTYLAPDGWAHVYEFDVSGNDNWRGSLIHLDVRAATGGNETVRPQWIEVAEQPLPEPDIRCLSLAPQEAANRVGKPNAFLLRLLNAGGTAAESVRARVQFEDAAGQPIPGQSLRVQFPDSLDTGVRLTPDLPQSFSIRVVPPRVGTIVPVLSLSSEGTARTMRGRPMQVLPPAPIAKADYVPEPKPAKTDYLIASYYYPGYGQAYQHRQMLRSAPWAKPALGYYDEGNPECIDWQIKWAVEHGVGCFLVDWYWVAGQKRHMHWFEGFAKARYRDCFKWAVMWANHNPVGTHSREDWRQVTQFWLDHYFMTSEYLCIDGKPVVAIWSPSGIRRDLGGSAGAKELLDMSQAMARAAGLPGIHFVAMNSSAADQQLHQEGYEAWTSYHWWGNARQESVDPSYTDFADVVRNSPAAWETQSAAAKGAGLSFWPVADTGWDARPRHGDRTFVIYNRTPELFRQTLADAKRWLDRNNQKLLVLGPWNEWTEGSYIEPCAEFDFRMLEAVRSVFCEGPPPQSVTPRDVGLGPYDFDISLAGSHQTDWVFDQADEALGWTLLMGLDGLQATADGLVARTTTHDPAIKSDWLEQNAADWKTLEITLQITPAPKAGTTVTAFWETERAPIHSQANVSVPLKTDTDEHVYRLDVGRHSRWRGLLRRLRLDPCQAAGHTIRIRRIRLLP